MNVAKAQPAADTQSMAVIIGASAMILALSFGVRSVFGGVVGPISDELFNGRVEIFSLSLAIQNLVWGAAQPLFGMIADRYGDRRALWLGLLTYLAGMAICIVGASPLAQHLGAGLLVGMGVSGTAFGVVLAVVGRAAPPEKRSQYLGYASALGSAGQVAMPFLAAWLTELYDWRTMLIVLTALLLPIAACIPLLKSPPRSASPTAVEEAGMAEVLRQAFGHASYVLLTLGFFVCGFHVAFIAVHLPNFVQHFCTGTDMSPEELRGFGLMAISVVGGANILGTLAAGQLGAWFPKPYILSAIYALRAVVILVFISLPVTPVSVMVFAFTMGMLWLSTVPLTSGLVAAMFGPKYMGTLYGFVFLSHQVGSFLGVWLGGVFFDLYGSYDLIWGASIALGVFSAIVHLPVREQPYQAAPA
ncbi:MAG: MFS transporter [Rhodobacteraceae bacterium]|nr:MFS transporter [Paracoccaceae bacterium]